ncbi:uncharacterized protein B4U79_13957 [Dinothrombium tinctorium]|uniref:DH domain-containing protein n=1 Tax=Dinothrombium tinctorium TaxID=1965070 RepID=A0A443RGQ1_9ACAR|nr:uncharacterized protein B4U79_13957 [Dinothrombium tinctorium]
MDESRIRLYDPMCGKAATGCVNAGDQLATASSGQLKKNSYWPNLFSHWRRKSKSHVDKDEMQRNPATANKYSYNSMSGTTAIYYFMDSVPQPLSYTSQYLTDTLNATIRNPTKSKRRNVLYAAWSPYNSRNTFEESASQPANCTCPSMPPIPALPSLPYLASAESPRVDRCKSSVSYDQPETYASTINSKNENVKFSKKSSLKQLKHGKRSDSLLNSSKSVSFATVNERVLRVLRKSIKDPFSSVSSKKSILECDLTAYDLIKQNLNELSDDELSDNAIDESEQKRVDDIDEMGKSSALATKLTENKFLHTLSASEARSYARHRSVLSKLKKGSSQSLRIGGQGVKLFPKDDVSRFNQRANNCLSSDFDSRHQFESREESTANSFSVPDPDYPDSDEEQCEHLNRSDNDEEAERICVNSSQVVSSDQMESEHKFGFCQTEERKKKHESNIVFSKPSEDTNFTFHKSNMKCVQNDDDSSVKSILKKSSNLDSHKGPKVEETFGGRDHESNSFAEGSFTLSAVLRPSHQHQRESKGKKHVHFRSYYDDTLIIEHINDTIVEEEESIYDDIAGQFVAASKSDHSETSDELCDGSERYGEKFKNVFDSISSKSAKRFQESDSRNLSQFAFGEEEINAMTSSDRKLDAGQLTSGRETTLCNSGHKVSRIAILEAIERENSPAVNQRSQTDFSSVAKLKTPQLRTNDYLLDQSDSEEHVISECEGDRCHEFEENHSKSCAEDSNNFKFTVSIMNKVNISLDEKSNNNFNDPFSSTSTASSDYLNSFKSQRCNKQQETSGNNKIVIDVSLGNIYETLPANDHIYESIDCESIYENRCESESPKKSMFDGASKDEILEYLEDAKERVEILINCNQTEPVESAVLASIDEQKANITTNNLIQSSNRRNRTSNVSNSSTDSAVTTTSTDSIDTEDENLKNALTNSNARQLVERNDSGVGIETSKPLKIRRSNSSAIGETDHQCADCEYSMEPLRDDMTGHLFYSLVCEKCEKKRSERKEIISEYVDTEFKYGRDLRIIREEFYRPMEVAGLLHKDQLKSIFLNLEELISVNSKFSEKLQDAIDIAIEQGDEDFTTVNIGKIFMESSEMLHAFETYCIGQGSASLLLNHLEKEKELLRIFLRVSQMENTLLRRMNLSAFLMVPVQRVTKYPLLLNRLYKVTPYHHQDREALREAQQKVELHLEHINQQTKGTAAPTRIWRRISNLSASNRRLANIEDIGDIKLRKLALEILNWSREEAQFIMIGKLMYTPITDANMLKKGRNLKFLSANALFITLGKNEHYLNEDNLEKESLFVRHDSSVKEAVLLLTKEKGGRFILLRDPLFLNSCVVSTESESEDVFEIHEQLTKESWLFKAEIHAETRDWYRQLRCYSISLGNWRRRRNALPNIMVLRS